MFTIIHGDAVDALNTIKAKAIFMDPPDNIGLEYDGYADRMPKNDYYNWIELLLLKSMIAAPLVWLSYHHTHDVEIKYIVRNILRHRHPSWVARTIIWRFTFGQYRDSDLASGYRPLLRLGMAGTPCYPDKIKVSSERMALGDPRAAGLRVPDDVWEIPRVTGNSTERRTWHPTQHPEALIQRIVEYSCNHFETFVDLFGGSGTSLRVCKRLQKPCTVVEQSLFYCKHMSAENEVPVENGRSIEPNH